MACHRQTNCFFCCPLESSLLVPISNPPPRSPLHKKGGFLRTNFLSGFMSARVALSMIQEGF